MSEIKYETTEKTPEVEQPKSEIFTNELIKGVVFKSDIKKETADDIYKEVMEEYFKEREEGPDTQAFKDYYETIKERYSDKSRDEVYEILRDEYEFLEDYLHRPDEEMGISLYDYNEMRCAEEYGDPTCDVDDDDDSNDPYYC